MAKNNDKNSRLKLIHLLYVIILAVLGVGIAWGTLASQQRTNCLEIEKKVDKELFNMYMEQQREQFDIIDRGITSGFEKVDKRLERIEAK